MHGSARIISEEGLRSVEGETFFSNPVLKDASLANLRSLKKSSRQTKPQVAHTGSASRLQAHGSSSLWIGLSPTAVFIVPCTLAVLCFVNGLPGEFVHDDVYAIENNRDVTGDAPLSQAFVDDFWGKSMSDSRSHKSYRPLTVLSFRLDYLLSGGDPRWFHAVNIALHACVTVMVGLVSMRVFKATPTVTMMAAAHFAVHPIHTEAVTGIVGRADVLSAIFFLASFYFYSRCIPDETSCSTSAQSPPPTPVSLTSPSPSSPSSSPAAPQLRDLNFNHVLSPASAAAPSLSTPPTTTTAAATTPLLTTQLSSCSDSSSVGANHHPAKLPASVKSAGRYRKLNLLVSLLLAAVSMLCKETGVTVLGVAFCYDVLASKSTIFRVRSEGITRQFITCLSRLGCLCVWLVVLLALRLWIMDFQQPQFKMEDNPAAEAESRLTRFLTFLYLPAFNLKLLMFPATLSYDWAVGSIPLVTSVGDTRNVWTGLAYGVLFILAWRSLRCITSQKNAGSSENARQTEEKTSQSIAHPGFVLAMALVFLCVPFIPASNLCFKVGFVVAERVLYIPSIGFSLLVAQGLSCLCSRRPALQTPLAVAFVALLLILGARTTHRNLDWRSRRTLFRSGLKSLQHNAKMHYNMANLLRDEGDAVTAELHYRQAISLYPYHPSYHLNLGVLLTNRSESEVCYQEALRLHPGHIGALVNLASLWVEDGKVSEGLELLQKAINLDPNHAEALLTMGKALLDQGEVVKAGKLIRRAMVYKRDWASAHLYYAAFLQMTDDLEGALREYLRVLDLDPEESSAMNNAARILISFGQHSEAEPLLKRALDLDPSCSGCLSALASIYSRQGQYRQAVVTLGHALSLAPNDTSITLRYVQALKQSKQSHKGQMLLQKLLAKVPDDLVALTFAYNYAMEENRLSDASQHIKDAVSVAEHTRHRSLGKLYFEQGEIFRHNKDYDNALRFYKKSIIEDISQTEAIVSAGSVLYLMKNYREAEVYYLKALEMDPNHRLAKHNLAKLRNLLASADSAT